MELIKLEDLMEYSLFSDRHYYRYYLLGYTYQYRNDRYIDIIDDYKFFIRTHNTIYSLDISYSQTDRDIWISNITIREMKQKIKYTKANPCNYTHPKFSYVILDNYELTLEDFYNILNDPLLRFDENIDIREYIEMKSDPHLTKNAFAEYINHCLLETRA